MRFSRAVFATGSIFVAVALLAGCGGSSGSGGLYGASSTATATSGTTSAAVVQTASVSVKGQQETALTDGRGYTLYYFDDDTSSTAACTAACSQDWPPLTSGASSVAAPAGVTGTLSAVQDGNGSQVEYNGHPLYTYSGDSGPGQANGDGIEGKWHVATPNTPQNTNGGGGYGYGQ